MKLRLAVYKASEKVNVYTENGYKNRRDYLDQLADEYGVSLEVVYALAGLLGPSEDFDGLVSAVQDAESSRLDEDSE